MISIIKKIKVGIAILAISCAAMVNADSATSNVQLNWNYPVSELSTNLSFVIYSSTNATLPMTNWTVLTNVVGTATNITLNVVQGENYYAVKVKNFWGESDFSQVVSTPAVPRSGIALTIKKL